MYNIVIFLKQAYFLSNERMPCNENITFDTNVYYKIETFSHSFQSMQFLLNYNYQKKSFFSGNKHCLGGTLLSHTTGLWVVLYKMYMKTLDLKKAFD